MIILILLVYSRVPHFTLTVAARSPAMNHGNWYLYIGDCLLPHTEGHVACLETI